MIYWMVFVLGILAGAGAVLAYVLWKFRDVYR